MHYLHEQALEATEKFLATRKTCDMFYQPEFSVYKFFKLFFCIFKLMYGTSVIKGEIVKQFYEAKCSGKYSDLLTEFSFFHNGIFVSSKQVEDGIMQMLLCGEIYRRSTKLIINLSNHECQYIINEFKDDKVEKMKNLIFEYMSP